MSEHPIIFCGEMIRAIRDRRKTQTRRVIKRLPCEHDDWPHPSEMSATTTEGWQVGGHSGRWWCDCCSNSGLAIRCPYGQPGDVLWVRESFCGHWGPDGGHAEKVITDVDIPQDNGTTSRASEDNPLALYYRATFGDRTPWAHLKWKSPVHMPRWACRLFLEVLSVGVERVQEISEAGVLAEGRGLIEWGAEPEWPQTAGFADLWDSLNAKPKPAYQLDERGWRVRDDEGHFMITHYNSFPWDSGNERRKHRGKQWYVRGNPWVWVIEFRKSEGATP